MVTSNHAVREVCHARDQAVLPGRQGGGWLVTLLLGVVGALLGGWIGGLLFGEGLTEFFAIRTWLLAIGGSILVLLVYGLVTNRRTHRTHHG